MSTATSAAALRKRRRRWWLWAALLSPIWLPLLFYGCIRLAHPNAGPQNIRISKETTHATGPLDDDGFVDYVAAINLHVSEGVTPQNNAGVLLAKTFGRYGGMPDAYWERFYRELGIQPLPAEGDYFVGEEKFGEEHPESLFSEQAKLARRRPWRESDFPAVADWLRQNERPLVLATQASQRPQSFLPLISDDSYMPVMSAMVPHFQGLLGIARALCARAMLRLGEGDAEAAWDDLLAVHRLARLAGQQPTLVECLVSYTMEGMAVEACASLAHGDHFTPELNARIQRDLAELLPLAAMADKIDNSERILGLDTIVCLARYGGIGDGIDDGGAEMTFTDRWNNTVVDWNEVLSPWNDQYDRIAAVARMPSGPERSAAAKQLDADFEGIVRRGRTAAFGSLVIGSRRAEYLQAVLSALLMPAIAAAITAEDRVKVHLELMRLSLAVAAYRKAAGEYPASLAELVPQYTTASPNDPFYDGDYVLRIEVDGFVLYSVGVDGQDDGGVTQDEADAGRTLFVPGARPLSGHDYVIHVPPKASADEGR